MQSLTQPYVRDTERPIPAAVNMKRSYDRYFATGLYASRYPVPNPHVMDLVLDELGPAGGRVLDFGCGSGRYAIHLARRAAVEVFAYDISVAAIQELSGRYSEAMAAGALPGRLDMLCGSLDDLQRRLDGEAKFDLVMLLFGVLGHIPRRECRVATLRSLRARLRPGGRLIATVPNQARRFLGEQHLASGLVAEGALEPGDIYYQREGSDGPIDLYYHLYSPAEFEAELLDAGFAVSRLQAESVLSERAVLSSPAAALADKVLRHVTPVSLAYGMVAVARPIAGSAG
jgi:SAM-dependent methyltransferase